MQVLLLLAEAGNPTRPGQGLTLLIELRTHGKPANRTIRPKLARQTYAATWLQHGVRLGSSLESRVLGQRLATSSMAILASNLST